MMEYALFFDWRFNMFNKYSLRRAKLHFKKISIFEKALIFFERIILRIKDGLRFIKLDKHIFSETIKNVLYITIIISIANFLGYILLFNNSFRKIEIISKILNSLTLIVDNYNQYLLACLGVGGFLIAMFLANLSGIITAKYMNIVSKTSVSILNEYANRKYLHSMINYLCIIIVQILFLMFNIKINPIVVLLTTFLTIRIIIIYFQLALRVFLFSDINTLTKTIYQEINIRFEYLKKAIKKNKSDSIFNSYGNQLISLIDTLKELQKKIFDEESTDDITTFTSYLLAIMLRYTEFKNLIPVNSKWYRMKYEPVNWFEADFYEVNLRIQTGTTLNNKQIYDHYFLENYIKKLFIQSVKYLINHKETEELFKVINNYHISFELFLANSGDFTYWIKFNKEIKKKIIDSKLTEDEHYLAIIDFLGLNRVTIILSSQKYINKTYNEYFKDRDFHASFLIKESNNNILFTNKYIVDLIEKIKYENKLEGKIISSDKYVYEILIYYFIKEISSIIKSLELNYNETCSLANKLIDKKNNLSACLIYSRILEIENKSVMVLKDFYSIYQSLVVNQYNLKFEQLNIDDLICKFNKKHYLNLIEYTKTFLSLDTKVYKNSKIDFGGEIFYNFSESILETILNNDYESFEKIYQYYPSICFMSESFLYDNLNKNYNLNYLASKYKIPIIMFMNLNGCIIYHSHLTNDKRWEEKIKNSFNDILKKSENSYAILKRMAIYASLDLNSFDINNMTINIKQRYASYLSEKKLIKTRNCENTFFEHKEIDSNDELIKKFTNLSFDNYVDFNYQFYEIFIIYYVNPLLRENDKCNCRLKIKKVGDKNAK